MPRVGVSRGGRRVGRIPPPAHSCSFLSLTLKYHLLWAGHVLGILLTLTHTLAGEVGAVSPGYREGDSGPGCRLPSDQACRNRFLREVSSE